MISNIFPCLEITFYLNETIDYCGNIIKYELFRFLVVLAYVKTSFVLFKIILSHLEAPFTFAEAPS